jgi:hypothetical protein
MPNKDLRKEYFDFMINDYLQNNKQIKFNDIDIEKLVDKTS